MLAHRYHWDKFLRMYHWNWDKFLKRYYWDKFWRRYLWDWDKFLKRYQWSKFLRRYHWDTFLRWYYWDKYILSKLIVPFWSLFKIWTIRLRIKCSWEREGAGVRFITFWQQRCTPPFLPHLPPSSISVSACQCRCAFYNSVAVNQTQPYNYNMTEY